MNSGKPFVASRNSFVGAGVRGARGLRGYDVYSFRQARSETSQ